MSNKNTLHLLLIAASAQGHLNPTLQLAKRLTRASPAVHVTFATMSNALEKINLPSSGPTYDGRLSFATFSTGFDNGVKPSDDPRTVAEKAKRVVSTSLHDLILSLSNEGRPIDLLIYTLMLPWAADVARELHVPSALLFIQSATSFAIYNRYFNGNNGNDNKSPQLCIELPGLPLFESCDLPTFLLPSSPHYFAAPTIEDHIRALERDPNPTVLINSFDVLEEHVINKAFEDLDHQMHMITIGPLIPSAFSDMIDPSDTSYGCDLFERSRDYLTWLEGKAEKSVIYVSFGSMAVIKRKQFEEILHGLDLTGRPYLWVVRPMTHNKIAGDEDEVVIEDVVKNGLGPVGGSPLEKGLIVPWCSQVEVLSHPSIGCFVTHCGWNSILESLVIGVPTIGVPQISDQPTNAKLVEEVWRVGIRAKKNSEADPIVDREEIKRCVKTVLDEDELGQEIRRNTKKWKELALEAIMEEGSSNNNLKCFLKGLQNIQQQEHVIKLEGPLKDKELLLEEDMVGKIKELLGKKWPIIEQESVAPHEQLLEENIESLEDGNHTKEKDNKLYSKENVA